LKRLFWIQLEKPMNKNGLSVLVKKEVKQIFFSFVSFFSFLVFPLFLSLWLFFISHFLYGRKADLSGYFGLFPTLFIILIPLLTMKSWVDDKKFRTDELLLTMPYTEFELVLAKYISVISTIIFMFILSIITPLSLIPFGNFDSGIILSSYIGLFLYACASVSICVLISCIVSGSIISWLLSATILIILSGSVINNNSLFSIILFSNHMESFSRGLINLSDIFFFLLIITFPLYLSSRIIIVRRFN